MTQLIVLYIYLVKSPKSSLAIKDYEIIYEDLLAG